MLITSNYAEIMFSINSAGLPVSIISAGLTEPTNTSGVCSKRCRSTSPRQGSSVEVCDSIQGTLGIANANRAKRRLGLTTSVSSERHFFLTPRRRRHNSRKRTSLVLICRNPEYAGQVLHSAQWVFSQVVCFDAVEVQMQATYFTLASVLEHKRYMVALQGAQ